MPITIKKVTKEEAERLEEEPGVVRVDNDADPYLVLHSFCEELAGRGVAVQVFLWEQGEKEHHLYRIPDLRA